MPLLTQNRAGENARERRQRAGRRARGVCTVCECFFREVLLRAEDFRPKAA